MSLVRRRLAAPAKRRHIDTFRVVHTTDDDADSWKHRGYKNPTIGRDFDMITKVRRVALVLATSAGIIAATTTAAHALGGNHCEPQAR
jgi:hypothetical protein